jgi:putative transposase
MVNAIKMVKDLVPVATALRVFNIPRATYHNYKTLVINKCDSHIFAGVKHYPHQLLKGNFTNQKYMENEDYTIGPSSIYLLALRNADISICLTNLAPNCWAIMLRDIYRKKNIFIVD